MRLATPRFTPLADAEMTGEQRDALGPNRDRPRVLNIFRTMARAPLALKRFLVWGDYILSDNSLSPRDRELVILRTGWQCRAGYEWVQHRRIGLRSGLTEAEVEAIKQGAAAPSWNEADRALLDATDELVADHFVSDATWARLASFSDQQRMDLVFTVGQYTQVSMILNTFGVPLDDGQVLDPDFPR